MNCDQLRVLGSINRKWSRDEEREIAVHLDGCESCMVWWDAAEVEEFEHLQFLAETMGPSGSPPGFAPSPEQRHQLARLQSRMRDAEIESLAERLEHEPAPTGWTRDDLTGAWRTTIAFVRDLLTTLGPELSPQFLGSSDRVHRWSLPSDVLSSLGLAGALGPVVLEFVVRSGPTSVRLVSNDTISELNATPPGLELRVRLHDEAGSDLLSEPLRMAVGRVSSSAPVSARGLGDPSTFSGSIEIEVVPVSREEEPGW